MNNAPLNNDRTHNAPINNVRNNINENAATEDGRLNPVTYLGILLAHANISVQPRLQGEPAGHRAPARTDFNIEGIGHMPPHYNPASAFCTMYHRTEGAEANHRTIANNISQYLRTQPMHVRYGTTMPTATCETLDGPFFRVSLFDGRKSLSGGTIVECRRLDGDSLRFFHERSQVQLAAQQNREALEANQNGRDTNPLPPLDLHDTEEESSRILKSGLANIVLSIDEGHEDTGEIITTATNDEISIPGYARNVIKAILNDTDAAVIRAYLQNKIGDLRTNDILEDRFSLLALRNILKHTDVIAKEHPWISGLIPSLSSILANANDRPLSASLAAESLRTIMSIAPAAFLRITEHHQFRDQIVQAVAEGERNNDLRQNTATALLHEFDEFMKLNAIYEAFKYALKSSDTLERFLES